MNNKLLTIFIVGIIFLNANSVYAVPYPCTQEELLDTSDYAIEGYVINIKCGDPYNSKECDSWPEKSGKESKNFKPELISDCIANVKVTKNLRGNYNIGDKVKISFIKLVQECRDGEHIIPGSSKKDFRLNSKIRYYNSTSCAYWNFEEIKEPSPQLESEPESTSEPEIKKSNWIYYLVSIGIVIPAFIIYWFLRKRK